jgi:hypothetical protein
MRSRVRLVFGSALLGIALAVPAGVGAQPGKSEVGTAIVSGGRQLSAAQVRARDITSTSRGRDALAAAARDGSLDLERRPLRVFRFRGQRVIVDAKSPLVVRVGRNSAGAKVFDVVPAALPVRAAAGAGYVVPPDNAWAYNTDGAFVTTLGTWKQSVFWTINVAWNYKACSSCTPHQYFRIYGKLQAATLTGANADQGFRRAWLEFDNTGAWGGSPAAFEVGEPEESYSGIDGINFTVGFGVGFSAGLGLPPYTLGGRTDASFSGSMTRHNENWHPVVRTELASGGVQWCRYDLPEFTGSKVIVTRVGIRQAVNAALGGWYILKGMEDFTSRCPTWI